MPLFDLFWSMLVLFLFIAWVSVVILVLGDVLKRDDIGGGLKAMWIFILIVVPWFGLLGYLFTAGEGIAERKSEAAKEQERALQAYIREAASSHPSTADELRKLSELNESGLLTDEEFSRQKARLLG